jgi:hypothetical protein
MNGQRKGFVNPKSSQRFKVCCTFRLDTERSLKEHKILYKILPSIPSQKEHNIYSRCAMELLLKKEHTKMMKNCF